VATSRTTEPRLARRKRVALLVITFINNITSSTSVTTGGNTYSAYLTAVKALGSSEPVVGCSLVLLDFPCTYYFSDNFQISNTGAVMGGVGATGVSSRAASSSASRSGASGASSASRSGASGTSSTPRSSASGPSSTLTPSGGASKPSSSSSPSYLVASDLFTLLATA
jgi:hypothetical protein